MKLTTRHKPKGRNYALQKGVIKANGALLPRQGFIIAPGIEERSKSTGGCFFFFFFFFWYFSTLLFVSYKETGARKERALFLGGRREVIRNGREGRRQAGQ